MAHHKEGIGMIKVKVNIESPIPACFSHYSAI